MALTLGSVALRLQSFGAFQQFVHVSHDWTDLLEDTHLFLVHVSQTGYVSATLRDQLEHETEPRRIRVKREINGFLPCEICR